jgi:recombinational DNA repair protein RecT
MLIKVSENASVVEIEDGVYSVVELFEGKYYTYVMDKEEVEEVFGVAL